MNHGSHVAQPFSHLNPYPPDSDRDRKKTKKKPSLNKSYFNRELKLICYLLLQQHGTLNMTMSVLIESGYHTCISMFMSFDFHHENRITDIPVCTKVTVSSYIRSRIAEHLS